jgi:subtilisin family serine protease
VRRSIAWLTLLLVMVGGFPPASGSPANPTTGSWLVQGRDPDRVLSTVAAHRDKLPADFRTHLRYVQDDGTLRVMVALDRRNLTTERFVAATVRDVHWYGADPRFYASVDQTGFASLLASDVVRFVEPDYPLSYLLATSVVDVSGRGDNGIWHFDQYGGSMGGLNSNYPGLSTDQVTGKGVTVAVVDSGIDHTHRDFGGWDCEAGIYDPCESRILKSITIPHALGGAIDPGDDLPTTELASGHGTHVAGIVAGNGYYARDGEAEPAIYDGDGYVIGMAPQASLVSVKVGDGPSAALGTDALQWTLDHAEEYDIRVSNNSWGCLSGCAYNPESVLSQIQQDLYKAGVVTVFGAGNGAGDGSGVEFSGHSQSPYVLSVASYDDMTANLSSFSSRGVMSTGLEDPATWTPQGEASDPPRRPDIAAPGDWIDSAASLTGGAASVIPRVDPKDLNQEPGVFAYTGMGGTSMATPHVTGAAALLLSACPSARPLDVMRALMAGAAREKIRKTDSSGTAEPFEVGYGGLNVRASLDWLLAGPCSGHFGRIEGSVVTAPVGVPIEGARVRCPASTEAVSDEEGQFAFEGVAIGTYRCTASAKGFRRAKRDISVEPNSTTVAEFKLKRKA